MNVFKAFRGVALILALIVWSFGNGVALGKAVRGDSTQSDQPETVTQQKGKKAPQVPKLNKKAIRIFLDKIEVAGRVERPQAIFIIPGKSPEVQDVRIDRSFFKEIFRKVEMPSGAQKKVRQAVRPELILW